MQSLNLIKITVMHDNSNLTIYIAGGIILLHFLIGFIYLIYKMNKKK